tara:strand:+ start:173 stop:376 length:204 start_codon:yes stop_codon:yes gene_type:complete
MQKLGVFKMIDDEPVLCGYFDNQEGAIQYLEEISTMINQGCQTNLIGEYVVIPMLYYELNTNPSQKK